MICELEKWLLFILLYICKSICHHSLALHRHLLVYTIEKKLFKGIWLLKKYLGALTTLMFVIYLNTLVLNGQTPIEWRDSYGRTTQINSSDVFYRKDSCSLFCVLNFGVVLPYCLDNGWFSSILPLFLLAWAICLLTPLSGYYNPAFQIQG